MEVTITVVVDYMAPSCTFQPKLRKKNHSKKSLPFSQKKYFLKFRENATLIFQKTELSSPKNKIFQDKISQTINNKQNLR